VTLALWILRALVILLVLRFVLRFVRSVTAASRQTNPASAKRPERLGGALVRDPQCGTYIPQANALTSGSGDRAVFFCSTTCRDAWIAAARR
jgi:hypothetical protein